MKTKFIFSTLIFSCIAASAIAQPASGDPNLKSNGNFLQVSDQWKPTLVPKGIIDAVPHKGYVTPWQPIREADILWKKTVWREIDVRQRQNFPFRYAGDEASGGGYFIEILIDAIRKGDLTPYSGFDDRMTSKLSVEDVEKTIAPAERTETIENPETGEVITKVIKEEFQPATVTKFMLKEIVYFDKNIGRMVTRIEAVCPVIDLYKTNADGEREFKASKNMFWLYYPELRNTLAKYEVYNPDNDVNRMTWDDYFEKRYFASFITKSTMNNPDNSGYDEWRQKKDIDRLYESEKMREAIFNKEHDLWVY